MNNKEIEQKVRNIKSWDEWNQIEKEFFMISQWGKTSLDRMDEDLDRENIFSEDNTYWQPFSIPYNIDIELYSFYERMSYLAYEAIEKEYKDESQYDKKCNYCRLWTENKEKQYCDFCGRKLQIMLSN